MIFGSEPTKALHDRSTSPRESLEIAAAICWEFTGAQGRARLRKLLGREHEKSDQDIPGMRGYPVWRYVWRNDALEDAPKSAKTDGLPTIYLLGPTPKRFVSIRASLSTTGPEAAEMLTVLADKLGVKT